MNPSTRQIESLTELINIGVGKGASVLNTMLNSHVNLEVPFVKILSQSVFNKEMKSLGEGQISAVDLSFQGKFSGTAQLVFPAETALELVTAVIGEESTDLDFDSIRAGTLCEVGNIVLNGVMGTIANVLKLNFDYSVPGYLEETVENLFGTDKKNTNTAILLARTRFVVAKLHIEGDIVLFFEMGALDNLLETVDQLSEKVTNKGL